MTSQAERWNAEFWGALEEARSRLRTYENRARKEGIKNPEERAAADDDIASAIAQLALHCGLPWTSHDGGTVTITRARHVLALASKTLDQVEATRKTRN